MNLTKLPTLEILNINFVPYEQVRKIRNQLYPWLEYLTKVSYVAFLEKDCFPDQRAITRAKNLQALPRLKSSETLSLYRRALNNTTSNLASYDELLAGHNKRLSQLLTFIDVDRTAEPHIMQSRLLHAPQWIKEQAIILGKYDLALGLVESSHFTLSIADAQKLIKTL